MPETSNALMYWQRLDLLRNLVEKETRLRLSKPIQQRFAKIHSSFSFNSCSSSSSFFSCSSSSSSSSSLLVPSSCARPKDPKKKIKDSNCDWLSIVEELQEGLIQSHMPRFCTDPTMEEKQAWFSCGLTQLRLAHTTFPELAKFSIPGKWNRARLGELTIGSDIPNLTVLLLSSSMSLYKITEGRPVVMFAGSST